MRLETNRYIPPDFADDVVAHLMLNRAKAENANVKAPTILIVQGPAGSGKTTSIRHLCECISAPLYEIHGKDMVSQWEGQATKALEEKLIEAANDPSPFQSVLLLDDAEMGGLRVDDHFTGTVNNNASSGWLMRFADNPREMIVESDKAPPRTIRFKRPAALIMTVNNISALHSPLVREGRAAVCTLDPRGIDLQRVLAGMFPKLSVRQAGRLVRKFPDRSVAFFAELGTYLTRQVAMRYARKMSFDFTNVDWEHLATSIADASNGATYAQLVEAGGRLASQSRDKNFVKSPTSEALPEAELHKANGLHNFGNGAWLSELIPHQPHLPVIKS
jgi:hypothetical protein